MRISKQGLDFIKSFEGCRLEAYHGAADRPGLYTIGYGHTGKVQKGQKITQAEADRVIHGKATPTRIYGGLLTENICQALAFDMLYWQAVRIHRHGIDIKANIHDCWIAVVPDDRAEADARTMESVMRTVPDWLKGFPVDCECESGHDFTIA